MKKICILLAFVLIFSGLAGCSDADSQNEQKADDGIWSVQQTTDEFGDVTADSKEFVCATVQGTYENKEVADSQFNVSVNFIKRSDCNHYIVEFQLTENDSTKIQFDASYIHIKTKVGEMTEDFYLDYDESRGVLSHGHEELYTVEYGGDYIFSNLYNGSDIKCIIAEFEDVLYSFELKSDNFKALCDSEGFTPGTGNITLRESVNALLQDKGVKIDESCDYLINKYETFDVVETEELKELLNGEFLQISLGSHEDGFCPWTLVEYSTTKNTREFLLCYDYSEVVLNENYKYGLPGNRDNFHGYETCRIIQGYKDIPDTITIEDNLIKLDNSWKQEIRRISDNIFITTISEITDSKPSYEAIEHHCILIKCESGFIDTVEYAQENYIQEIPY